MAASKQEVVHAYRHLYQHGLRAANYSSPSRYVVRDHLREAFRNQKLPFEPKRIANTLRFLDAAAKSSGTEHKTFKNICYVWWSRSPYGIMPTLKSEDRTYRKKAFDAFDSMVQKLNESMHLCIR